MEIRFAKLKFDTIDNKIYLSEVGKIAQSQGRGFYEVQIAGENSLSRAKRAE